MAKKAGCRTVHREAVYQSRNHLTVPDEITLRDEILELKRQVLVLKRTNEQYLVKIRKYEDETKRKDKQLEQLLDPRKNAAVTKVLSTKGAAILMNLKDQNNTLIQMMLNKDLHIRRLVAELKMSKLYASARKNEGYRAEIARLRSLLVKSQETLKENVDVQQRTRSICVSGNSLLEFSSSSDQSSPRYLDDLRMTILGLESHIQHSNDLLAKKNQEISHLTDELNILRKFFRYKTYKNKAFDCEAKNRNISTPDFTCKWSDSTKTTSQHFLDAFEKNAEGDPPHSAPAAPTKWISDDSSPFPDASQTKKLEENYEKMPTLGKSLFHSITTNEILNEGNSRSQFSAKQMWQKALNKIRELNKSREEEKEFPTGFLDVETEENSRQGADSSGLFKSQTDENGGLLTPNTGLTESTSELCQTPEKTCKSFDSEKSSSKEGTEDVKAEENSENTWEPEEEAKRGKSLREIYRQSLDSSFDSDSSYSVKPEIRQVQVEVQINSFSPDRSESSLSENSQLECGKASGENCVIDFDFNDDDDDVIVREK